MQTVATVGLDIAKSVFQVHCVDAAGQVVFRRQLKRRYVLAFFQKLPRCLIGIEACASSHHWSRQLQTLGHTVRLMPAAYVTRVPVEEPSIASTADSCTAAKQHPSISGEAERRGGHTCSTCKRSTSLPLACHGTRDDHVRAPFSLGAAPDRASYPHARTSKGRSTQRGAD
jgi:hypothetical protein